MFVPVRTIPAPVDRITCYPHDVGIPPVTDRDLIVAVDWRTRLGGWRRERCCGRCLHEFLHQCSRDSDVVVCWFPSTADDALAQPRPVGEHAQWPAEALGRAA